VYRSAGAAQQALGRAAYTAAYERGRALPKEEVLAFARDRSGARETS